MKKMFMVGAAVLMAVGAMFVSCSDIANGCNCTDEYGYTLHWTQSEVKIAGVNTCAAFAAWLGTAYNSYTCTPSK